VSLVDLSSPRGIAIFGVIIAYPAMDTIIIVPSFLIVVNYSDDFIVIPTRLSNNPFSCRHRQTCMLRKWMRMMIVH
jgi:hypothetical protein